MQYNIDLDGRWWQAQAFIVNVLIGEYSLTKEEAGKVAAKWRWPTFLLIDCGLETLASDICLRNATVVYRALEIHLNSRPKIHP